ncbi:MAG: PP2C family protein-serine/threonine phosphatase [Aggregatilineales bacterium]
MTLDSLATERARVQQLEAELEEMTVMLAQSWDQLVSLMQDAPGPPNSTTDIVPFLESIMAALDAPMGAVYLLDRGDQPADWFVIPSEGVSFTALRASLNAALERCEAITVVAIDTLSGYPSAWLLTPLVVSGRAIGVVGVGFANADHEFKVGDKALVRRMTERVASQIIAASLRESEAREAKIAHELQIAGLIQRSTQPIHYPQINGIDLAVDWRPASIVGGDAWGWVQQPNNVLAVFMVDVAGKGLPAALGAVSLHTLIKMALRLGLTPVEVLRHVNSEVYETYTAADLLATAVILSLDLSSGLLMQANAGHPPTLIRRGDEWLRWRSTAPPLGVLASIEPELHALALDADELVIVYSDGLTELKTDSGFWGEAGLKRAAELAFGQSAKQVLRAILESAQTAMLRGADEDDQTILCLQYLGR